MTSVDDPRVADLSRPENLPGHASAVDLRFTHGSLVFLTDDAVFKIKRAKDYGFFDYSTLAARKHFCEEEVRLNRRTAPRVYRAVLPVYRDARGYSLTRAGKVVDYAVHMRRLPDELSALAKVTRRELGERELAAIALRAAEFYAAADRHPPDPDALRRNIEDNFTMVEPWVGDLVDAATFSATRDAQRRWLQDRAGELAHRECRDGHGDLRLEHVYLLPDGIVFIDCIEFSDAFRIADPALDAAFLAMDLHRVARPDLAEVFLAAFETATGDREMSRLLDGYMSYRAFVRAKVAGLVAFDEQTSDDVRAAKRKAATKLFALALRLIAS